ncbi:MAG: DNA repair protein RecN, partial [Odoribacteraceae bacterium]|nr:DNA repair protein RecN [Odoribacteraceae bacterium]
LSNAEEIKRAMEGLSAALTGTVEGGEAVVPVLRGCKQQLMALETVSREAGTFGERLQAVIIELRDIAEEAERSAGRVEFSEERAREARERLDDLYDLLHKYRVADAEELIQTRDELAERLRGTGDEGQRVEELSARVKELEGELEKLSDRLHASRVEHSAVMEGEMQAFLVELGMPHARFSISVEPTAAFTPRGRDAVTFFFSANRNQAPGELSRMASGGEVSRLMLSMKYLLSSKRLLPAVIFDEIDTGVSGEIAHRVAMMLKRMSGRMQVISISHLPQIAAVGGLHFKVYKEEGERTLSRVKRLTEEERAVEIAGMMSGSEVSEVALENARLLLRQG